MTIENQVLKILQENIEGNPPVSLHADLRRELNLDSFGTIMIINALEDDFNIAIEDADFEAIHTASDILKILKEKYNVQN
jgi:acyl carrier protein